MESNEQTELTGKIETDSEIENMMTSLGQEVVCSRGIKQKEKMTHGHGQQYGDCWEEGDGWRWKRI